MEYIRLGGTGLEISRLCLGCMNFGDPRRGRHSWALPEADARPFFKQALDAGINFFDTANMYSGGSSEEITGRALLDYAGRDDVVIATKLFAPMRPGPNSAGLSRKAIMSEIDHSLGRLGTDYVDLYQIHRWDYETPIEETLEALHDVVQAGKARYIGASYMHAWQFSKALHLADRDNLTRFVSMQSPYSLLYREEEREMLPLCRAKGVGFLAYSPLARGALARSSDERTPRAQLDHVNTGADDSDLPIIDEVQRIAADRGVSRAQVALAWVLGRPGVTAPVIGPSKPHHITDAVAALDLKLTDDEVAALQSPYRPHTTLNYTFRTWNRQPAT